MNNLKHYRKLAGLTQRELAEKSDISLRLIQDYEQGHKKLQTAYAITVLKLANILNCTVSDLIEIDKTPQNVQAKGNT